MSLVSLYLPQANAFKHSRSVQSPADLIGDEVRDLESDTQAEQYGTELQELREGIIAEVAEKRPICYERFNLCELRLCLHGVGDPGLVG